MNDERTLHICFSDKELDAIIEFMKKTETETVQSAVMNAISIALNVIEVTNNA